MKDLSLALAESVVLDTPIISTDVGIAKELIEKYDCGHLIDYDEQQLANVLLKYIEKAVKPENSQFKKSFNIGNEFRYSN